jgi:hypothetical protein
LDAVKLDTEKVNNRFSLDKIMGKALTLDKSFMMDRIEMELDTFADFS